MEKDELLEKRIRELANLAERRSCVTFTDFLNLNEQNILHQTIQKFSWIKGETFGGYAGAERQIAAFVPDAPAYAQTYVKNPADEEEPRGAARGMSGGEDDDRLASGGLEYPIACVRIEPVNARFAEALSHRDILGALMSLGIDRAKTGDIALCEEAWYLFCHKSLAPMICEELTRIRHTSVKCALCSPSGFCYTPKTETVRGSVASVRLDSVMALAFGASRSSLLSLIEEGRVFVNGRLSTTNAYALKEGDLVSVRGLGRFRYGKAVGQTKKGRCMVEIEKYIS